MVNSKITIKCRCGNDITINVKSIDILNNRISCLEAEVRRLNNIINAKKLSKQTDSSSNFMNMFDDILKG